MLKMKKIQRKYDTFRESVIKLQALRTEKEEELQKHVDLRDKITEASDALAQSRSLLEKCNIVSREFIKQEVEQLVTQSLRAIFGDPHIQFNIEFVEKRNQTEAVFSLSSENDLDSEKIESDVMVSYGGGLVDIISVALRVIIMQLLKLEGPLVLDEPGKNISDDYIEGFGRFLVNISKAFDRQIIMVTHNKVLANCASNTIKVTKKGKISQAVCVSNEN